tara:strand:+ start:1002 stop:1148 length:147 start_codon:yes stop_codon:yes gene_type:complete
MMRFFYTLQKGIAFSTYSFLNNGLHHQYFATPKDRQVTVLDKNPKINN